MRLTLEPFVTPKSRSHPSSSTAWIAPWTRAECCLALFGVVLVLIALLAPAVVWPVHEHSFIDTRSWWGIPNTMDVLSNAAFAVVGTWGLWRLGHWSHAHRTAVADKPVLYGSALIVGLGLWFTTVGSGIFHWEPNAAGLAVDRMGMSVIFAGLLGMAVAQHISERAGLVTMVMVLTLAPVAAAVAWFTGNATPWGVVQYGGMLLLLALVLTSSHADRAVLIKVLLMYSLAKACEMADEAVWQFTNGLLSGHTLKHLVAAIAVVPMWDMLVYGDSRDR